MFVVAGMCWHVLACGGCMMAGTDEEPEKNEERPSSAQQDLADPGKAILVTEEAFVCLKKMRPVRGFFVGNLLGNLDATVAAALQPEGSPYPPGSIVQLIPAEAMIKHRPGWNAKTNDWEFFELDVSEQGAKIKVRGTIEVVNKFGGNCYECHQKAKPQRDFICEHDHG